MTTTISCFYSCDACGARRHVDVPERDPAAHDVIQWLERVASPTLEIDHRAVSPTCRAKGLSEVGIPIDEGTEHVGVKTIS